MAKKDVKKTGTIFIETFKNYNSYNYYKMEMTTIALTKEVRDEVKQFGSKGDTYSDIVEKLIKSAKERQLHDLLMNEEGTISIDEALSKAKRKWRG